MTIRPQRPADLPALLDLWLQGNLDAHPFIPAAYWEKNRPAVAAALPEAEVLAAEEAGELVGFIGLQGDYIAGLFVRRDSRGRGVGRALLAAARTARSVLTLRVYAQNTAACRFYAREGFTAVERTLDPDTGADELLLRWNA